MAKGPRNSEKEKIHLNSFIGGMAVDYKYGIANSFYYSQALDFRTKPSQMSVLPGMSATSTTLKDLITCMCQDNNGIRYAVGNQGYIYKINTAGVITVLGQLTSNGAAGIVYNYQSDSVYITSQNSVSIYSRVSSSSPQLLLDQFGPTASIANAVIYAIDNSVTPPLYDGGAGTVRNNLASIGTYQAITPSNYTSLVTNTLTNTYIAPSTISEASTNLCTFIPDITPLYSVAIYVTIKGTGNLTLTIHDSLNNNLGSATISNANLTVGWNNFVFTTPITVIPQAIYSGTSAAYHFHVTSSVASDITAFATISANDMTGTNFVLFINRLSPTNNGWHPAIIFNNKMCIGNGSFLSTYDFTNDASPPNTSFIRQAISLDPGYEITSLSVNNQYLVIAAEKRSKSGTNSFQDGYLYFWDGYNAAANFKIEIPMGAPYSVQTLNNITYFICAGSLFAWGGGQQVIKVRYLAYQNTDYLNTVDQTIVNPNMLDIRYNLLMIGYPSKTTNVNINYGIYSWGSVELTFPNSFCYSYAPSISSTIGQNYSVANNLQLGMVKNFVDTMYTSWQYTDAGSVTRYGLDILNNSSTPATSFNWQSLIYDGGVRYKRKRAQRIKINFLPLPAGTTLTGYYIIDRGSQISTDPTSGQPFSATTGGTSIIMEINNARFYELQWGLTGTTTSGTSPVTITGITCEIDPREEELAMRNDHV